PRYDTGGSLNPLLPQNLKPNLLATSAAGGTGLYDLARERLRVFSASTPSVALREYDGIAGSRGLSEAQQYGRAIALLRASRPGEAARALSDLLAKRPGDTWVTLALAEAEARSGKHASADSRFESLLRRAPGDRAIALTYARTLAERDTREAGQRAQAVLRPLLARSGEDPEFQQVFARACEIAGDPVRAGEAYAEAAYLNGRPELALVRLENLKKRDDLDYYARARIDSRIAAITPTVLELRRQGIRDEDLRKR
ncbi:tetratricopeptide repeat protein, partial [Marilutibacter maris]